MRKMMLQVGCAIFVLAASVAFAAVPAEPVKILFIGDSLTQGYGVRADEAFPEVAGRLLETRGYKVQIVNGGISGSMTAAADQRLRWYLKAKPAIVVFALGANDGLKGTPADVIEANLDRAIQYAKSKDVRVVLTGQKIFKNFGTDYVKAFDGVFPRLAKKHRVVFMPFLLEDVALKTELNQPDGRHPNAEGHKRIAENLVKLIEPMIKPTNESRLEKK
jgi:acyl-CoA thioesterase I